MGIVSSWYFHLCCLLFDPSLLDPPLFKLLPVNPLLQRNATPAAVPSLLHQIFDVDFFLRHVKCICSIDSACQDKQQDQSTLRSGTKIKIHLLPLRCGETTIRPFFEGHQDIHKTGVVV